jgi:hypothetical protein
MTCDRVGHKARDCMAALPRNSRSIHFPSLSAQHPSRLDDASTFPMLPVGRMSLPGNPELRPMETAAMASSTSAMEEELLCLSACSVVAYLWKDDIGPEVIGLALCSRLGVLQEDIKVSRHRPGDFLITFVHQHHRNAALELGRIGVVRTDIDIRIKPWRILPYCDLVDLRYHIRICLEGIATPCLKRKHRQEGSHEGLLS